MEQNIKTEMLEKVTLSAKILNWCRRCTGLGELVTGDIVVCHCFDGTGRKYFKRRVSISVRDTMVSGVSADSEVLWKHSGRRAVTSTAE